MFLVESTEKIGCAFTSPKSSSPYFPASDFLTVKGTGNSDSCFHRKVQTVSHLSVKFYFLILDDLERFHFSCLSFVLVEVLVTHWGTGTEMYIPHVDVGSESKQDTGVGCSSNLPLNRTFKPLSLQTLAIL